MDITTASPADRKREYDRIAVEMNDDRFFTTKELNLLPKVMASDEWLYGFSSGFMDNSTWLIVLTSKRVIFLNKKLMFGHDETSIGLGKINSVQKSTGIMMGSIMLHDGSREYVIKNVWKKSVIPFTNRLNKAIEDFERSMRTGVPIPEPVTPGAPIAPAPQPEPAPEPTPAPPPPPVYEAPVQPAPQWHPEPVATPTPVYRPAPSTAPVHVPQPEPEYDYSPATAIDDPVASRQRLDRLRAAGAIDAGEHADAISKLPR